MQFRTLILVAALVAAVAAQGGNYKKEGEYKKETSDYSSSSSSSPSYSSSSSSPSYSSSSSSSSSSGGYDSGYGHQFAAPPFWVRWHTKLSKLKAKIAGGFKCLAHSLHQHWINLKSDVERVAYWLKCEKTHFKHWWQFKCDVEKGKKKIRSALEQQYYDAICKLEKEKKAEYESRVKECKDVKDEYGEDDEDYTKSTTTEDYKVEKVTKAY
jgi:hypothetical protein